MPPPPSATYQRLRETIAKRMRMSHIDQPLMLVELLGRRSPAPAQDVARRILGEDVTQIDTTTERVKRMVGRVLPCNGITRFGNGANTLIGGDELSDSERDELLRLCRQRLDGFRAQRGEEVLAHRSRHRSPFSSSIKYRVLTRARGAAIAAVRTNTSAPWKWTTSSPGTRAAPTTSATCRLSTSAVCRPAKATAKQAVCSGRWSSSPGGWCSQRPNRDQILITNRSDAGR